MLNNLKFSLDSLIFIAIVCMYNVDLVFMSSYYGSIGRLFYIISLFILFLVLPLRIKVLKSKYLLWYVSFCALMMFTSTYSMNPVTGRSTLFSVLSINIPMILLILMYANTSKKILKLMNGYIAISILQCIIMIKDAGIGGGSNERYGFTVTGETPTTAALNLCAAVAFSYYFFSISKKTKRWFYLLVTLFFTVSIFLTGSRKQLIFIVGIFILYTIGYDSKMVKKVLLVIGGCFIGYYAIKNVPILYDLIGSRIFTDLSEEHSAVERAYLMKTAISVFLQHPFIGNGFDSFRYMNSVGRYAHNNYLEILTGMGIMGLVYFYYMQLKVTFRLYLTKSNKLSYAFLCAMLLVFLIEFFQVTYTQRGIYVLYTLAFCQASIELRNRKKKLYK